MIESLVDYDLCLLMVGQNIAIPLDVGSGWLADAIVRSA